MLPLVKELGKKSIVTFGGQIIGNILSMVNLLLVVRCLDSELYGYIVYVLSFYEMVIVFVQFGLGNTLVSFLARDTVNIYEKQKIITFSLLFSFVSSLFFSVIFYWNQDFIAHRILNISDSGILVAMLPYFLLDAWTILLVEAVRSQRFIHEQVFANSVLWPGGRVLFFTLGYFWVGVKNYWSYLVPMYLAQIVVIVYAVNILRQCGLFSLSLGFSIDFYKKIGTFSFAVLLTNVVAVLTRNIDKYMLGFMSNASEVGIYHVALTVGTISSIGLSAVNNIFAPMISMLYFRQDISGLRMIYRRATKWVTVVNLFLFGLIFLFSKDIMHIAGESFVAGGTALVLVSIGEVVNSAVGSVGYMNVMTGHPQYNMCANVVAVIFNIAGNWILIPQYGINGAAIATAGSLAVHNVLNFMFMQRYLQMHPFQSKYFGILLALIVSSSGAGIYAYFSHQVNFLFRLLTGSMIYGGIFLYILFVAGLEMDEKDTIKTLQEKCYKWIRKVRMHE